MKPLEMDNASSMPKFFYIENMINLITQHSYFDKKPLLPKWGAIY
jgi:hypothetical protein